MKTHRLYLVILATAFMLACNLPALAPPTQTPGSNENSNGGGTVPLAVVVKTK